MSMDLGEFKSTLEQDAPSEELSAALQALWHQAKGDWAAAHKLSQSVRSEDGAWVHAYLHRVEGDIPNADYWYKRAGKLRSTLSLEKEWSEIARALLSRR